MNYQMQIDSVVQSMARQIDVHGTDAIKPGNNGPYYDKETNIRNLAHWCVIFSEYYRHTEDSIYREYTIALADAIVSSDHYYDVGVYKCRIGAGKDEMNGVIGAAWIIEGLIAASKVTGQMKYYERAKHIFLAHKFNYKMGLWNRVNLNGNILSIDSTFNHQLWFAAAGAIINNFKKDKIIQDMIDRFAEKLPRNITVRRNGRIGHFTYNDKNGFLAWPVLTFKNLKSSFAEWRNSKSLAYKEAGYHTFNLLGLALLQENTAVPLSFFKTDRFKKCINYALSEDLYKELCFADRTKDSTNISSQLSENFNVFSFAYNSPAFELPRVMRCFNIEESKWQPLCEKFMIKQMELTYDAEKHSFLNNTDDPITLTARIYEYIVNNESYWRTMSNG